jgi:hypothetical protein
VSTGRRLTVRIPIYDIVRAKKAARYFSKLVPEMSLAGAQEALAKGIGYGNWYELAQSASRSPDPEEKLTESRFSFRQRAAEVTLALAQAFKIDDGLSQYALSRSHLLGNKAWSDRDHESVRTYCWRQTVLPASEELTPGMLACVTDERRPARLGYLIRSGRPSRLMLDDGTVTCAEFEVLRAPSEIQDFVPMRLTLPYGSWTTHRGEVLFSRDYMPLWRVEPDRGVERLAPWLWIDDIQSERWFCEETRADWTAPVTEALALEQLTRLGITGLPMLADILPIMCSSQKGSVGDAVQLMRVRSERRDGNMSAKDQVDHVVNRMLSAGDDLALVSSDLWDGLQSETGLKPEPAEFGDDEIIRYRGISLMKSAAH